MKWLIFIILTICLSSCVQKVSNSEFSDEIYKDLVAELDIVTKSLDAEEKNLVSIQKELADAVPQTGQIKFSRKKVYDAEGLINSLRQQKQFFQIKIEQRIHKVRGRYEESQRTGGRPWPDPNEITMYRAVIKFNRDKISWEKDREAKKLVPRGTSLEKSEKKND